MIDKILDKLLTYSNQQTETLLPIYISTSTSINIY